MAKRSQAVYIIPYLPWQREGDEPFELSRLRMVNQLDRLLGMQNGNTVLLDGQSMLRDYLALRPHRVAQLTTLLNARYLDAGPWYVPPEPILTSPEALIRNLLLGQESAGEGAAHPQAAYMPDVHALPGQLPQILSGFGIEALVVQMESGPESLEQWWDAPDGSRLMLVNARPLDKHSYAADSLQDELNSRSHTGKLPLFEATRSDVHQQVLTEWSIDNTVSDLQGYLHDAQQVNDFYPLLTGEICPGGSRMTCCGMLSSRIWLKQRHYQAQTVLERWAEPFSAWAALKAGPSASFEDQHELLMYAWQLVVKSHSPDALRGTCVDRVEREVDARLDRAVQIAEALVDGNLRALANTIDTSALPAGEDAVQVVVFNSSGQPSTGLVSLTLPRAQEAVHCEVVDETGQAAPCEVLIGSGTAEHSQAGSNAPNMLLRFTASDIPAYGYRAYSLRPAECVEPFDYAEDSGMVIENEFLQVGVNPTDGTLTVIDRRTGARFTGLNRFVDGGDRGDLHTYSRPERDTLIDFPSNPPGQIERLVGPVTQMLNILQIYRLPKSLTPDGRMRLPLTRQFAPVPVTTTVYLARGVPRVDIEVHIENSAENHRMTVHFPTGIPADEALYDGHFEINRRPVTTDVIEQPQHGFVTVLGGDAGLTIANRGLPAANVLPGGELGAEIALTLLRCVGQRSENTPADHPGAQGLGQHSFAYSIIPHGPDPFPAWQQARAFQSPLRSRRIDSHDGGLLPASGSLVAVDTPAFVLTAVKQSVDGQGLIVRGFNVSSEPQAVALTLGVPFDGVTFSHLNEKSLDASPAVSTEGICTFEAAPHEIVTLRFDTQINLTS